jgi:replicative DNA helicase
MSSSVKTESRQQEVSHVAREMKSIAKDFKVPVIGISSLSRGPETRSDARPKMSDLRESGDIESEADVVALVYRQEYYKQTEENAGVAELIIDKNRHGPTGTVKLAFLGEYTRFENYYGEYNGY